MTVARSIMSMLFRVIVGVLLAIALLGCGTSLTTLQPAEPMRPGHVHATGALDLLMSQVSPDDYDLKVANPPSVDEARQAKHAALARGARAAGFNPDVMVRMGVIEDLDVGARYSGGTAHLDAKLRFLSTKHPTREEERREKTTIGSAPDHGFQGAVSVGGSRSLFLPTTSGPSLDGNVDIDDFTRWNVEVPVIFGARFLDLFGVWFGPKYVYSHIDLTVHADVPIGRASVSVHQVGGFLGVSLGPPIASAFVELTVMQAFANADVLGGSKDVGGTIIQPSVGVMMRP
ncbi:MAG: hypothetical protein U0270_03245 [Labilithrix sp.]